MAIKHWTKAPTPIQRRIRRALEIPTSSEIERWHTAASDAWLCGYDIDPPPQHATELMARLRREDPTAAGDFSITGGPALMSETRARELYAGKRAWAAKCLSPCEQAERRQAEQIERDRQAAHERRVMEIAAELEKAEHDKRMQRARQLAEQEIGR